MLERSRTLVIESPSQLMKVSTRRDFLRMLGVGGAIVMLPAVFTACGDNSTTTGPGGTSAVTLNLGTDIGILNYAYALEQLEAAFYSGVVSSSAFSTLNAEQQEVMIDLRNHEVIHREFFRQALGSSAIGTLDLNASVVATTMTSVAVILKSAEMFEDLGVSAYNGAGKYLQSASYLTAAGKIVSVEARHAAAIRDIRDGLGLASASSDTVGTRFAGDSVVSSTGLDVKLEPSSVLGRVISTGLVSDTLSVGSSPAGAATADAGPPSPTP